MRPFKRSSQQGSGKEKKNTSGKFLWQTPRPVKDGAAHDLKLSDNKKKQCVSSVHQGEDQLMSMLSPGVPASPLDEGRKARMMPE